jgi:succinate dehydrogenase / fumarate reductase, flavoprotein subunit
MFNYVPAVFRGQYADTEDEGDRWYTDPDHNKRPPELLPRDEVARAINSEVKAGRGSPHGGVFLDISWIKEKLPKSEEHIKRKLPSMYHQFMQLAGIDITKEPMEIGPTTHYVMGGIRVDGDTQMSTIPGLFACGECAAGLHGANRLGGNSLSDLIVFGKRAGEFAAKFAKSNGAVKVDSVQVEAAAKEALAPFDRPGSAEGPYQVQEALQETMQDNVGIVRAQAEMEKALAMIGTLKQRAAKAPVKGNREYNPGWHTALDLGNLLTVSEAIARSAMERKESRGGHFRDDYPDKSAEYAKFNFVVRKAKGRDGEMQIQREPIPPMPDHLKAIIEEMK